VVRGLALKMLIEPGRKPRRRRRRPRNLEQTDFTQATRASEALFKKKAFRQLGAENYSTRDAIFSRGAAISNGPARMMKCSVPAPLALYAQTNLVSWPFQLPTKGLGRLNF